MQLRVCVLVGMVLTSAMAFAADDTFDRTLTTSGSATLNISNNSGYIHIYPGSGEQVHIVGHVHAHPGLFGGGVDETVRQIVKEPPISQSGNTVTVRALGANDVFRRISIDYDVTAPPTAMVKAGTGSGGIEIGGIRGEVTATAGSGSIHVDNIAGNARLETGSGSIDATNVHGGAVLGTGSGRITFDASGPGDVRAHTGSGGIRLSGVEGSLRAETGSGGIELAGKPTDEWRAHTGSGGIHVQLATATGVDLQADAGSGSIHIDQPIAMQSSGNRHHISGTINGGGPTLRLGTGSGGISVQ